MMLAGCYFPPCAEGAFRCENHQCVPDSARCDGKVDCKDRSDEDHCEEELPCPAGRQVCVSGAQCVRTEDWCDHKRDCPDGSDEMACQYRACIKDEFRCASSQCVPLSVVCNHGLTARAEGCYDNTHLLNCKKK
ncbi:hypothetical protein ACOMHN_009419 [Nucella lapillus]